MQTQAYDIQVFIIRHDLHTCISNSILSFVWLVIGSLSL